MLSSPTHRVFTHHSLLFHLSELRFLASFLLSSALRRASSRHLARDYFSTRETRSNIPRTLVAVIVPFLLNDSPRFLTQRSIPLCRSAASNEHFSPEPEVHGLADVIVHIHPGPCSWSFCIFECGLNMSLNESGGTQQSPFLSACVRSSHITGRLRLEVFDRACGAGLMFDQRRSMVSSGQIGRGD